jgi:hypothetical protein
MPVNRSRQVGRGPDGGALKTGGRHAKIAAQATATISSRMRLCWFLSRTSGLDGMSWSQFRYGAPNRHFALVRNQSIAAEARRQRGRRTA